MTTVLNQCLNTVNDTRINLSWSIASVTVMRHYSKQTVSMAHCTIAGLTQHQGCTGTMLQDSRNFVCVVYLTVYIGTVMCSLQCSLHPPGGVIIVSILPCGAHTTLTPPSNCIPSITRGLSNFFRRWIIPFPFKILDTRKDLPSTRNNDDFDELPRLRRGRSEAAVRSRDYWCGESFLYAKIGNRAMVFGTAVVSNTGLTYPTGLPLQFHGRSILLSTDRAMVLIRVTYIIPKFQTVNIRTCSNPTSKY